MNDSVVIPASKYPHGYVSMRSLAAADVRTILAVTDSHVPATQSWFADEVIQLPDENDLEQYCEGLLGLAERPDVQTIIPHRPQDAYLLSHEGDRFTDHVSVCVPSVDSYRLATDRFELMCRLKEAGLPVPDTQLLSSVDRWDQDRVIKSRYNVVRGEQRGGPEAAIETEVMHVPAGTVPDIEAIQERMGHDPIVQEYVRGSGEFVFGALAVDGQPRATFQHRQLRGNTYVGGGGVARESVRHTDLDTVGRRLLDVLGWDGLACVEYVQDAETGAFKPLEVNPRMWQSLSCAVAAGANVPKWYWQEVRGCGDRIEPGYQRGVRTHYLYGELGHLVSIRRESSPFVDRPALSTTARQMAGSWMLSPRFDMWHRDDPWPAIYQVRDTLRHAIGHRLWN